MPRFLADENFNGNIVRGLRQRLPDLDVVRVQDVGLTNAEDPPILEWAAGEGRVLLTHDICTVPPFAHRRVAAGQPMPGVVVVAQALGTGAAIGDLVILIECSLESEWQSQVRYLPL